jgi:aryl-alcohol dehydrogenase-like predicted oxidoreductase
VAWQLRKALWKANAEGLQRFDVTQPLFDAGYRDDDPTANEGSDGARGSFDNRFEDYYLSERGWHVLDEFRAIADEADATPAQVASRWLIAQPSVTTVLIVGARTTDQLAEDGTRWGHR